MTDCTNITEKKLSFPQFCKFVIGDSLSGTLKRGPHTLACGGGCGKREGQAGRARVRRGFRGRPAPRAQAPRTAQPRLAVVTTAAVAPRAPRSSRGQAAGSSERRLLFPMCGEGVSAAGRSARGDGEAAREPPPRSCHRGALGRGGDLPALRGHSSQGFQSGRNVRARADSKNPH